MSAAASVNERAQPRALPRTPTLIAAVLALTGIATFFYGLSTDAETTWRAFHVNYLYFGGVAQGGIVFSAAMVIIGARWAGPLQRGWCRWGCVPISTSHGPGQPRYAPPPSH